MSHNKNVNDRSISNKKSGMAQILTSVAGIVLISKVFGFLKQMITANAFGATIETDLISLSQGFYGNIEYVIAQVFTTAFVSIYIRSKSIDIIKANRFVSDVIKVMILGSGAITGIIIFLSPFISKIIAPTYNSDLCTKLNFYLVIFSPILIVFAIMAIFQSLLNANDIYIPGQLIGLNQSIIVIVFILSLSDKLGIRSLIISAFIYPLWNILYLWRKSRPYLKLEKGNPFKSDEIQQFLMMMGPLFVGYSMVFINQQVDKILVSGLEEGTVTAMGYSSVLSNLIITLISSFCTVFYTRLTETLSVKDDIGTTTVVNKAATLLITFFLPISIITILCSKDIVAIAFGRGNFGGKAISNAAMALTGYGFIFVPNAIKNLCSRYMYGDQNSRIPMINSSLAIVLNIILSILLVKKFQVFGITFASSVAEAICALLNIIYVKKHMAINSNKNILQRQILLWLFGSCVCVLLCIGLNNSMKNSIGIIRFTVTCIISLAGYILSVSPIVFKAFRVFYRKSSK